MRIGQRVKLKYTDHEPLWPFIGSTGTVTDYIPGMLAACWVEFANGEQVYLYASEVIPA